MSCFLMKGKQRSEPERRQQEDAAGPVLKTRDGTPSKDKGQLPELEVANSALKLPAPCQCFDLCMMILRFDF